MGRAAGASVGPLLPPRDVSVIKDELEWAGKVLLAMKLPRVGPREFKSNWPATAPDPQVAYGYSEAELNPPPPPGTDIVRMEQVLAWVQYIPDPKIRRVVHARSLVSPVNDRYLFPWRRIAKLLKTDRRTLLAWHRQGLGWIRRRGNPPWN